MEDKDPSVRQQAMAALLDRYRPALRAWLIHKKRLDPEGAETLLQSFITSKVLERDLFAPPDSHQRNFRVWLVAALNHYLGDHYRRRGAPPAFSLSDLEAPLPADGGDPRADVFTVEWARELLSEVLRRMRAECEKSRRLNIWGIFECRILGPILDNKATLPYDQLVARFGFRSPTQAANALVTAKRMLKRSLRTVVTEYAGDEAAVEAEIRDLQQVLEKCRLPIAAGRLLK